jgi:hypothetical protein
MAAVLKRPVVFFLKSSIFYSIVLCYITKSSSSPEVVNVTHIAAVYGIKALDKWSMFL